MNNKVKKVISVIFILSCFWTVLSAATKKSKKSSINNNNNKSFNNKNNNTVAEKNADFFQIVCTSFPQYDWVMNILGDEKNAAKKFEVSLLQNSGTDMHSYQPSVKDIAKISTCSLFIYVGGESDLWVEKILKNAVNKKMICINLLEILGERAKQEEFVEGMQIDEQDEHTAEHNHDEKTHEHEDDEIEYDEHVWLSLKNAAYYIEEICKNICLLDREKSDVYKQNAASYQKKILALDNRFSVMVEKGKRKTILFADRFPFRYFADDYGLQYFAAFASCSAESEASFETIAFLAKKIDEFSLPCILVLENSDGKIAKTVISSTKDKNQQILQLDSLQSITKSEIQRGKNYLNVMEKNFEVLQKALN